MSGCSLSGPTDRTRSFRRATTLKNVSSSSCGVHDLDLAQLPLPLLTLRLTQTPRQRIPSSQSPLGAPQPPASVVCHLGGLHQEGTPSRGMSRKLWLKFPVSHKLCALLNVDGTESESLSMKISSQMLRMRLSSSTLQRSGPRCYTPHSTTVLPPGFHSVSPLTSHTLTC
jgi:hypothetical protein